MRITWVTRSFLDYRIPVYQEINRLCGDQLTVIYYDDIVPVRCQKKIKKVLGDRAVGLGGEMRLGGQKKNNQSFANSGFRIPIRPGLTTKVRATKPDILLSDGFYQWTYAALINNAIWSTPHVMCYERTPHTERNASKFRIFMRKIASRFIDAICCNGIKTKEYLTDFGFPEEKLFMGNMAADTTGLQNTVDQLDNDQKEKIKTKYDIEGELFLYVGQLIPRKGILEMLKAWREFSVENPGPTLILLGDGEQKMEAQNYITENNIGNVRILGRVNYSEVAKFYAAADIFIISTLEDNWSLVVPEAMSCSLPVLCSKYNGCWPELVKPQNGWVFDPLETDEFVHTLEVAWQNRDKWEEMGINSSEIIKNYTPEKVAESIYEACEKVVEK
ncbi:glycosyltransferase family 4 protein [Balneolaceae bacterium YR4-1]|uniref:Glycosyltransferase family 4 protein n=1 Tax=Halalkalibaculum roseum TaxID=2709311 RepID=A0A6M1T1M1_9BACT|nr:glycosyltransferase family 4 protein [Halalkalibaculum roseum]NGP75945.1 glycosyltransferase family 4 protein [Halalkalibaculum roseum]